jgi:hypothetical protein
MGRPLGSKKQADGTYKVVDPADQELPHTEDGKPSEELPKPPRGRPHRAKRKPDFSGLEALVYSIHLHLSIALSIPELKLEKEDVTALREASETVASYYDIPEFPQKLADHLMLAGVVANVYGTRLLAYNARRRLDKRPQTAPEPSSADDNQPSINGDGFSFPAV